MTLAIPASQLVKVNPGVVGAAGQGIVLNGLCLTTSTRVPIGTVASFTSAAAVAAFFGNNTPEAAIAAQYFLGFANATISPGALLFAQYAWETPRAAYLQSGPVSNLTLAQLQAISGTLIVTIDGETFTSSSFNLAAATSFSTAAALIQTALAAVEATITATIAPAVGITANTSTIAVNVLTILTMASGKVVPGALVTGTGVTAGTTIVSQLTGSSGGAGTYQVSIAQTVSAAVITTTNNAVGVMDATAVATGTLAIGQNVQGAGVAAGTIIVGELDGTGGTGNYIVSPSQTVGSEAMSCGVAEITYDSVSGSFFITGGNAGAAGTIGYGSGTAAAALNFTQANGAILSQGTAPSTPIGFMNELVDQTQNWFSFFTTFDPVTADKVAFALWSNDQDIEYLYVMNSGDAELITNSYASTAWGEVQAANYDGTLPAFDPTLSTDDNVPSAAIAGFFAALNFNQVNGRQTLAYRQSPGLPPGITSGQQASQLVANGVNFYGVYSSADENFVWWQRGVVSGRFLYADTYAQAVFLKNQLQVSVLTLLGAVGNIPYNTAGDSLIESACQGPIDQMLAYGGIRTGVQLSPLQIAEVNNAAGLAIDGALFANGYYLQIGVASADVRVARGSPPITLWYCDGQSVQNVNIASLVIE